VTAVLADDDQAGHTRGAGAYRRPDAAVSVVRLAVAPAALHIGDNAELEIALRPRLEPAANHGARLRASGLKTSTRAGGA
jgi:hypothetical protein